MSFPSIVNISQRNGIKTFPQNIFEDLKISHLLSAEALLPMRTVCTAADISERREVFRALEATSAFDVMSSLYELSCATAIHSELFSAAEADSEKAVAFASLCASICRFAEKSADTGFTSPLLSRFSSYFKDLTDSESFCELRAAVESLPDIPSVSFRVTGEELSLLPVTDTAYTDRLAACAGQLGITLPDRRRAPARRMAVRVCDAVASLYPEVFKKYSDFSEKFSYFYDPSILSYREQLAFYLEVCRLRMRAADYGIPCVYPTISNQKHMICDSVYDVTLILKNQRDIVPNDIDMTSREPFFFLTGANGGGKTTYMRAVGVTLVLFLTGCPVFARSADIFPFSCVFTHFPQDERFDDTGRFLDEERRIDAILESSDEDSVILLNETYSTTAKETAEERTESLARKLYEQKRFGIYITHQHAMELTDIPLLSVAVDENDNNKRTYRIVRRKTSPRSFANDILIRYGLTRCQLAERFGVEL